MTDQGTEWDRRGTYKRNASSYAWASEALWHPAADRLVELLALREGMRVLDVATGPGRVARRAAEVVGASGRVLGIDSSAEMLAEARRLAASSQLTNVDFGTGDMHALEYPPESYGAVAQGLSIYLAQEGRIPDVLATEYGLVRRGGRLAVSTCGSRYFAPLGGVGGVFVEAVQRVSDVPTWVPWDDTDDPAVVRAFFSAAGIPDVEIETRTFDVPMPSSDTFWEAIALGTGYSHIVERLTQDQVAQVRAACENYVIANQLTHLEFEVIYASTQKPAS